MGCAGFARYCGKMDSRHHFSLGELKCVENNGQSFTEIWDCRFEYEYEIDYEIAYEIEYEKVFQF